MLLCCVLRTALSISFGAVVQIVIFLLQNSNILRVQASLPPGAEDEIILIEHLPGRRVHLQDFFWSDAKDAPPWVDPNQGLTIYETRTVHHTVTLYSPSEDKENPDNVFPRTDSSEPPKCTTCIEPTPRLDDEDQNIGILVGEDPGPRYWLLTVLRSGEAVPPKIELKLARLYKTAFLRQQQRHLGLSQTDPRFRRVAREEHPFVNNELETGNHRVGNFAGLSSANLRRIETKSETTSTTPNSVDTMLPFHTTDGIENRNEPTRMDDFQSPTTKEASSGKNISIEASADFDGNRKLYNVLRSISDKDLKRNETSNDTAVSADAEDISESKRSELRSLEHGAEVVQVRMQNTSVTDSGATKLIYSVHLGGKPVPAETAARDMALLSAQEVALELGAPVLIQSEPYLKETRPLALSRKRDAWLLIGAASAGFILLALVVAGLIFAAKRKRTHSAVAAPSSHRISNKRQDYVRTNADLGNNVFLMSELEIKTDGTSQRRTPGSLSRTPISLETPDSIDAGIREVLSDDDDEDNDDDDEDDDEQKRKTRELSLWENPPKKSRVTHRRMSRSNAIDTPRTSDSTDVIVDHLETLDSIENNYTRQEEATASPHSYLSMPSCKPFPSMKSVEPLSRVLEPVMVKHLDLDSPELIRREDDRLDAYRRNEANDKFFARTSSATKDPGVVGPIVWNLRKQNFSTEGTSGTESDLGKAKRRLHELLEDSFSLFGSRDPKSEAHSYATQTATFATHRNAPDVLTIYSETKGRSTRASPVSSPLTETKARPRTSFPGKLVEGGAAENGHPIVPFRSRTGWSSRPLSAGPFHRPNLLPDVDARRVLTDSQLPQEDPAVPLIASIKKELEKFSPQ